MSCELGEDCLKTHVLNPANGKCVLKESSIGRVVLRNLEASVSAPLKPRYPVYADAIVRDQIEKILLDVKKQSEELVSVQELLVDLSDIYKDLENLRQDVKNIQERIPTMRDIKDFINDDMVSIIKNEMKTVTEYLEQKLEQKTRSESPELLIPSESDTEEAAQDLESVHVSARETAVEEQVYVEQKEEVKEFVEVKESKELTYSEKRAAETLAMKALIKLGHKPFTPVYVKVMEHVRKEASKQTVVYVDAELVEKLI